MVNEKLLSILVCPVTKQPVRLAEKDLVLKFNSKVKEGSLKNVAGALISEEAEELLIRSDNEIGYRVVEGIPVMLPDEGVTLKTINS